uniref:Ninja-family protein n=1 Tax=Ananas comosus var. bracteatus TaxID=296719 RepID=A0A6V7PPA1_ANACO|nr:unnamed protein product [Ananas comosus var. bracteatus]
MGEEATGEEKRRVFASSEGLFQRDLLRRFAARSSGEEESSEPISGGDSDEIELSLGLSLGGRFGAESPHRNPLVRSSSIASLTSLPAAADAAAPAPSPLMRTSSLPTGAEEEQRRKRREAQSLKRLEAKRKRLERRNSIKTGALTKDQQQFLGEKLDFEATDGVFANKVVASLPVNGFREVTSQGSSSSGEGRPGKGVDILVFSSSTDAKTPPVVRTLSFENSNPHKESRVTPPKAPCRAVDVKHITGDRNPSERVLGRASSTGSYMMEEMPCVSTKGEGPNGRRIEGFLYKYGKGEEVRIVCICHGSFWTPAEFVRHAGGGEVANPLKHIIVDPSALTFLG